MTIKAKFDAAAELLLGRDRLLWVISVSAFVLLLLLRLAIDYGYLPLEPVVFTLKALLCIAALACLRLVLWVDTSHAKQKQKVREVMTALKEKQHGK